MYADDIAAEFYGQATDSGQYDDVEMYGPTGDPVSASARAGGSPAHVAWLIIALSLAGLWIMGAAIFKGSNHS